MAVGGGGSKRAKYKVRVAVRSLPPVGGYLGFKKEDPKDVKNYPFIIEVYTYPQIFILQCNLSPVTVPVLWVHLYLWILYEWSFANSCWVTVSCHNLQVSGETYTFINGSSYVGE